MNGSVTIDLNELRRTDFQLDKHRLSVRTTDGDFFRFTPKVIKMEGGFGETISSISFHGFHIASKLNHSEWMIDGKVESITALWRICDYELIHQNCRTRPCAGVIADEFYSIRVHDDCMYAVNEREGSSFRVTENMFDELLVPKNNVLPNKSGFYRNDDGSMFIKFSTTVSPPFDLNNQKPISLGEMVENGPWTKVAFVDVES